MKLSLLFVLLVTSVFSQVPNIDPASITTIADTNVIHVTYQVDTATPYCWVLYGVVTNTYIYSSPSFQTGTTLSPSGLCAVALTGLKDGTTYYILPTARPNADDEVNGCMAAAQGCGTSEKMVTTLASTVSHLPALPASVTSNMLIEPNTTGPDATNVACSPNCYTVATLTAGAPGNECWTTAIVNAPSGYSGSIPQHTTLTQIFARPDLYWWYGTIFQVQQTETCMIPYSGLTHGDGYGLPSMSTPDPLSSGTDDMKHRFIVFKTKVVTANDFQPFSMRTDPSFFGKMGGFKTANPNLDGHYSTGSIFYAINSAGQYDHIGFQNLQFAADETQTGASYEMYINFGPSNGRTSNFQKYIYLRGNRFVGEPSRNANLAGNGGLPWIAGVSGFQYAPNMNIAIVGNYADSWWYGATTRQYPNLYYFGDGDALAGGPILLDNNFASGLQEHHYLEVNFFSFPNPHDVTVTRNFTLMPTSNPNSLAYAQAVGNGSCGRASSEFKGIDRGLVEGNYYNGQFICSNYGAPILAWTASDFTVRSNYIQKAGSFLSLPGGSTAFRGIASANAGNRELVTNNYAFNLGRSNWQAGGGGNQAVFVELDSAVANLTITNNTIGQLTTSGGTYTPLLLDLEGGGPVAGLTMANNILPFAQGPYTPVTAYNNNSIPTSHPATPAYLPAINGAANATLTLSSFAGYADGAAGLGMTGISVIAKGSNYANDGTGSFTYNNCSSNPTAAYLATPAPWSSGNHALGYQILDPSGHTQTVTTAGWSGVSAPTWNDFGGTTPETGIFSPSVGWTDSGIITRGYLGTTTFSGFGVCTPGSMTATATTGSGASVRAHYGLTANYNWGGNVNYCTYNFASDMSQGDCDFVTANMPRRGSTGTGNTGRGDVYMAGANTSLRTAATGILDIEGGDLRCKATTQSSCSAGANMASLEAALGIVSQISVSVDSSSAAVNYTAPDSRACSVDISANGTTWTRLTDSGGSRVRTLLFTGLSSPTTYQHRIGCYFNQTEAATMGLTFPSDTSNLSTNGTFTTLAVKNVNPPFEFLLPSGLDHFKVTLTALDGTTTYTATCTAPSPCVINTVPIGDYSRVTQYLAGATVKKTGRKQTIPVR